MWAPSRAPAQRSHGGSIRRSKSRSAGVNVVITLTVIDKYQAVENNVIVEREFRVVGQAAPFRVHDSVTELKELARKFLVDLFGNSQVPPAACLVDFSEVGKCAKRKLMNTRTLSSIGPWSRFRRSSFTARLCR